MPVLAKGKTITGRLWTYVRDDRPFGGPDPPAAVYAYSRNRDGEHPRRHLADYGGILQADAFAGFNALYDPSRKPGPITEAACWAHARRKFFVLADVAKAPLALEAVRRIDALFDVERALNGLPEDQRLALRQQHAAPLVAELEAWMRGERARLSRHNDVAKAMDYMLKRWPAFTRFLDDGKICLTNNAAERALRGIALGRRSWLFAGSDRGGERAAAIYTLITTAKLNDVDPQAWLEDVLRRIADHPASRLADLLPWNWQPAVTAAAWHRAGRTQLVIRGIRSRWRTGSGDLHADHHRQAERRRPAGLARGRSPPHRRPPRQPPRRPAALELATRRHRRRSLTSVTCGLRRMVTEIGLQVFLAQTVVDAEHPGLQVGKDAVDPRQHDMGGDRTDDMGIMGDIRPAGIARPAVGADGGAGSHIGGDEAVQRRSEEVGDLGRDEGGRARRLRPRPAPATSILPWWLHPPPPPPTGSSLVREGCQRRLNFPEKCRTKNPWLAGCR